MRPPSDHLFTNAKQAVAGAMRDARDQVAGAARTADLGPAPGPGGPPSPPPRRVA